MLKFKSATTLAVKACGIPLEIKAVAEDGTIEGYGSVFGVVDSYGEEVMPGAFIGSVRKRKASGVRMLWQHNTDQPIGIWSDLSEDSKGLYVKGQLLKDVSPQANEAYGLLKAGAIDGLSIGYRELKTEPHPGKPGVVALQELDLREISVVTFAANEKARVDVVKSWINGGELPTVRQFEEHLRESGFPRSLAAAIAGKAAPHLRGDPEDQAEDVAAFLQALRAG
jgi:HK97 family phage prohead protease